MRKGNGKGQRDNKPMATANDDDSGKRR